MPTPSRCCGHPLQVIPLRSAPAGPGVELLRCRSCARSRWRSEGTEISRNQALDALGQRSEAAAPPAPAAEPATAPATEPATAPATARPRRRRSPAPTISIASPAAPSRAAELRELLADWQVLGS